MRPGWNETGGRSCTPTTPSPRQGPEDQRTPEQAKAYLIHHPRVTPGELASRYPSHLHINLVPRLQSGGHGQRLISTLTDALRRRGSRGVHLTVRSANGRAAGLRAGVAAVVLLVVRIGKIQVAKIGNKGKGAFAADLSA